eukprot:GHUV01050483.1.p1 GENE.GHUV01050483.1~~GHUV01050483.1.p1  ORF type:complete len:173 (-),score=15.91 GHUV01050483.1:36-554(-)
MSHTVKWHQGGAQPERPWRQGREHSDQGSGHAGVIICLLLVILTQFWVCCVSCLHGWRRDLLLVLGGTSSRGCSMVLSVVPYAVQVVRPGLVTVMHQRGSVSGCNVALKLRCCSKLHRLPLRDKWHIGVSEAPYMNNNLHRMSDSKVLACITLTTGPDAELGTNRAPGAVGS